MRHTTYVRIPVLRRWLRGHGVTLHINQRLAFRIYDTSFQVGREDVFDHRAVRMVEIHH